VGGSAIARAARRKGTPYCTVEETGRGADAAVPVSLRNGRRQGDTIRHGPGHLGSLGHLRLPQPPEAGQLLSMVSRLVLTAVGVLDPTARLSLI
jgi:hypothetical protein